MPQEQTELDIQIRAAFDSAQGQEEDAIKLAMISAGATFKNVTRLFNQFMVDAGLAVSKEEKDQIILGAVDGQDLSVEEIFNTVVAGLATSLATTEKSAAALIRAYAKKNELECFKKAKGAGGAGKVGFVSKFHDFLVANPLATEEQAVAFIQGTDGNEETSENTKRHQSAYMAHYRLANTIAKNLTGAGEEYHAESGK